MLSNVASEWNLIFQNHKLNTKTNSISIVENDPGSKFKKLTININKALDIPTRDFSQFDLFEGLSNQNCDGGVISKNDDGTFDIVFIELKSGFDSDKLCEAKNQIIESYIKMNILMSTIPLYNNIIIRNRYGIIVSLEPDVKKINWIDKMLQSSESSWGKYSCSLTLYKRSLKNSPAFLPTNNTKFSSNIIPKNIDIYYYTSKVDNLTISLHR